jgi:predicted DNA-binding protein
MVNNRGLKNRRAFSNSLSNELYQSFEQLHQATRIPKSKLLDEAISLLIEKYKHLLHENVK